MVQPTVKFLRINMDGCGIVAFPNRILLFTDLDILRIVPL